MNIVLIGYRGTGKSVVGAILAARLGMPYLSMDALIADRAGMTIPEIVTQYGWPGFRDWESALACELAKREKIIIDCGGGIVERPVNIEALRATGVLVWLQASVATIVARIQDDTMRPSLTGKSFTEEVAEVLERRTPLYKNAAHYIIDTDHLTPGEVVATIVAMVSEKQNGRE